jgi:hypothetical protein
MISTRRAIDRPKGKATPMALPYPSESLCLGRLVSFRGDRKRGGAAL